MKVLLSTFLVVIITSLIQCTIDETSKRGGENKILFEQQSSEEVTIQYDKLPDSLFYKLNLTHFKISDIPFNLNTNLVQLKLMQAPVLDNIYIIFGRKEQRINAYYYSKQNCVDGYCITIYLTSEEDSGSIYYLKMDKNLTINEYHKIGFDECSLLNQTEECDIIQCNQITTFTKDEISYYIVMKSTKQFDCIGKEINEEIKLDTLLVN